MIMTVLSSDGYTDCWRPFFTLKQRYYPDIKAVLVTETKQCPYCETININEPVWTKRVRQALEQIDDDRILIMLEDFFIRRPVDLPRIQYVLDHFDDDTATYNFEINYRTAYATDMDGWAQQLNKQIYLLSAMPGIWDRRKLMSYLQSDQDAWSWELTVLDSPHKFFINTGEPIIDINYRYGGRFGISRGKWVMADMGPLCAKEGLDVDFSRRPQMR